MRGSVGLVLAAALAAPAAMLGQGDPASRVYVSSAQRFVDLEAMTADLASADVVFVGEEHNDENTHRLELALLQSLARRRGNLVLSLEMFERDTQEALEHFLLEHSTEAEFLAESRPWPQYTRHYKPLVDLAVAKGWWVVAANVPRTIAAAVSEGGLEALQKRPATDRALYAADIRCPAGDDYFRRFVTAMGGGHTVGAPPMSTETLERYYQSQCLKDETMAESIARAYTTGAIGGQRPLIVAFNGTFHSDYGLGTAERTRRRLPERRVVVTTIVPVSDPERVIPDAEARRRADYLIYSRRSTDN